MRHEFAALLRRLGTGYTGFFAVLSGLAPAVAVTLIGMQPALVMGQAATAEPPAAKPTVKAAAKKSALIAHVTLSEIGRAHV